MKLIHHVPGADPEPYFFETEKMYGFRHSIYDEVQELENVTTFQLDGMDTEDKLKHIKHEIELRIKITNLEIFNIGELLHKAKKICQEQKILFKDWISENLDFSYETAHNFMNVFKYCLGHRQIALNVPTSILYRCGSPSFPDELRELLFTQGKLEKWSNGKFKKVIEKYKEGGIEAVEAEIEEFSRGSLIYRQCKYNIDLTQHYAYSLCELRHKIMLRGKEKLFTDFEIEVTQDQPEASEVNVKLFNAIDAAYNLVHDALKESRQIMNTYERMIVDKM